MAGDVAQCLSCRSKFRIPEKLQGTKKAAACPKCGGSLAANDNKPKIREEKPQAPLPPAEKPESVKRPRPAKAKAVYNAARRILAAIQIKKYKPVDKTFGDHQCPNCGNALSFADQDMSKSVVCSNCGWKVPLLKTEVPWRQGLHIGHIGREGNRNNRQQSPFATGFSIGAGIAVAFIVIPVLAIVTIVVFCGGFASMLHR
jgi:predicted RNA-binding Zn-ribbon protein involved in translation (DUF1610 family)